MSIMKYINKHEDLNLIEIDRDFELKVTCMTFVIELDSFVEAWNTGVNKNLPLSLGNLINQYRNYCVLNDMKPAKSYQNEDAISCLLLFCSYYQSVIMHNGKQVLYCNEELKGFVYAGDVLTKYFPIFKDKDKAKEIIHNVLTYHAYAVSSKDLFLKDSFPEALFEFKKDNFGCELFRGVTYVDYACKSAIEERLISEELLNRDGVIDKNKLAKCVLNEEMYMDTVFGVLIDREY